MRIAAGAMNVSLHDHVRDGVGQHMPPQHFVVYLPSVTAAASDIGLLA